MNKVSHTLKRFIVGISFLLGSIAGVESAEICVQVKLEIPQKVTLEREAFDARLKMTNFLKLDPLTNIKVEIYIRDEAGNPVKFATPEAEDPEALFFMKISNKENIAAIDGTGVIDPQGSAVVHWLIIPTAIAGGILPEGKKYYAKAHICYSAGEADLDFETWEEEFTVKPQPKLALSYALPGKVYGDDPFTDPIEPPVPFKLAVRVANVGYGTAKNAAIESAQPKIVENVLGLLIDFKLLGSWLNGEHKPTDLKINFGDILPQSCKIGMWDMISTLNGKFVELAATYTHKAELGGALTSLLEISQTYLLVHDIVLDDAGRDAFPDLLVSSDPERESTIPDLILSSQNTDIPVKYDGTPTVTSINGGLQVVTLPPDSWLYVKVNDPYFQQTGSITIVRADGKVLNQNNYWRQDKKIYFADDGANTTYYIRYSYLDTGRPQSSIGPLSYNITSNRTPTFYGTSTDTLNNIVDIEYRIDGGIWRDVDSFTPALSVRYRFTTPPLSNGVRKVEVRARDAAGNTEETAEYTFTVDTTPPSTCCHNPAKTAMAVPVNTNIELHILDATSGVDQSSIGMKVEGQVVTPTITGSPSDYLVTYNPPVDFGYSQIVDVEVSARDLSMWPNAMQETYLFVTQQDTEAPNSTINPLFPDPTTDTTPTFTGNAVDTLSPLVDIEYRVDWGVWTDVNPFTPALSVDYSLTTPALMDGTHTVEVRAKDSVGNVETSYAGDQFVVYCPPGTPTITLPLDGAKIGTGNVKVTGMGKAMAQILVYANGSQTTTGNISTGGSWTTIVTLADGTYTLTARVKDWANNISGESLPVQIEVDTTPPATPTITSPASGTVMATTTFEVRGTGEANSTYNLYVSRSLLATGTTLPDGTWSATVRLMDGAYQLQVVVVDGAGNRSPESEAVSVIVDTIPTGTPSITSPVDGAIINSTTFIVQGSAEANAPYTLYINDNPLLYGTASVNGTWQIQVSLADGFYTLTTTYKDWAGTISPQSLPVRVKVDTGTPGTPTITLPLTGAVINKADVNINGGGEANTTYMLYVNGTLSATGAVLANGTWQTLITLTDGTYSLRVVVKDGAGNFSPQSLATLIEIDTIPPGTPTITLPVDSAVLGTSTIEVRGTGEANGLCTVYVDGIPIGVAAVSSEGNWQIRINLVDGSYTLTAIIQDRAGNFSPQSPEIKVKIDTVPPAIPTITSPENNAVIGTLCLAVQGTGEEEGNFILYANGSQTTVGSVSAGGIWQTIITLPDSQYNLTCIVKDRANNQSPQSLPTSIKIETTAPGTPSITSPSAGAVIGTLNVTVTGTAEPDTTYILYVDGSETTTGNVANNGIWQTTIPLTEGTHNLAVAVEDWTGKRSPQSTQITVIIDITPPGTPTITAPLDGALIGIVHFVNVVGTAEANTNWTLYVNGSSTAVGTVTADGKWEVNIRLEDGTYTLTCRVKDKAGNQSPESAGVTIVLDTTPPAGTPTITAPLDGAIINNTTFEVHGSGESNTIWVLYVDGGLWTIGSVTSPWMATVTLQEGAHTLTCRLRDKAYNYGPFSSPVKIKVDATPPEFCCYDPAPNTVDVPVNTNVVVHVRDAVSGVASVEMKVQGGIVYPDIDGTPMTYTLTYDPVFDFDYDETVNITIDARDFASNITHQTYLFTTQAGSLTQVYLPLYPGWNLIALPLKAIGNCTAESLGQEINNQNGSVTIIQAWDGSGWKTHLIGKPFGDFNLETGQGYFVYNHNYTNWQIPGTVIHTLSMEFNPGWNLIGLPQQVINLVTTAEGMGDEINSQDGACSKIQTWDGSGWMTHLINMPFGDFDVGEGSGYFVYGTKTSVWSPNRIKVTDLQQTQFTLSWKTALPTSCYVNYGITTSPGSVASDNIVGQNHSVTIDNLQPDTTYYFDIVSNGVVDDNHGQHYTVKTKE